MQRQRLRVGLVVISFILFPVTIFYLSPVHIVVAASKGIINGSFLMFGLQFLSALVLGRGFCGWVCPAAGLSEACSLAKSKPAPGGRLNLIKYLIWVPWLAAIVFFAIQAGGYSTIDPLYATTSGISLADIYAHIPYYTVVGLITILALTAGQRGFCHYVCWMAPFMIIGAKLQRAIRLPALHLRVGRDACRDCGRCSRTCPMGLPVNEQLRTGRLNDPECILCGQCIDGCPTGSLKYGFGQTPQRATQETVDQ